MSISAIHPSDLEHQLVTGDFAAVALGVERRNIACTDQTTATAAAVGSEEATVPKKRSRP